MRRWPATALGAAVVAVLALTATVASGQGEAPYQDARLPVAQRVADLLGRMTLEEKAGQMVQVDRALVDGNPSEIASLGLGSVISGGGSAPKPNTPKAWADMVDRFQRAALANRLHIPVLYGVDSIHGDNAVGGATIFPHQVGMGATRDPKLVEDVAHVAAEETRASGPQWTFAPCLCVVRDERWGRSYESFGESPDLVRSLETAIDGFQGGPGQLSDRDRVMATAKHFAGDGDTRYGTSTNPLGYEIDQGVAVTSRKAFDAVALAPYAPAVRDHHVGAVMPSYSSVDWTEDGVGNPIRMHADGELLTGELKGRMGFDGIVISDFDAIHQLPGDLDTQVATAVNAGVDMLMEFVRFRDTLTSLIASIRSGRIPMTRVDDAVRRILTKKFELGLFEHPLTDRANLPRIGSAAHHALARRAAAESAVLLRNRERTLPLPATGRIYVAGSNADDVGNQAGGWTLTWQGGSKTAIRGTTILDGIRSVASRARVTFSKAATAAIDPRAAGVVVVGETSYAEGYGDVGGPRFGADPGDHGRKRPAKTMRLSAADRHAIDRVCARAASCTVVVVSGRPLVIDPAQLRRIDALVAAWLPGSEGAGIADVLLGRRPFSGKLPVSWPRTVSQEPINAGDARYDPLYRYGFGLTTR